MSMKDPEVYEESMVQPIGAMKFKYLRRKAYEEIWNTVMDVMETREAAGFKNVSVKGFPPLSMRLMSDELMEAGYDVTVEVGEYSGDLTLHLLWG